jgi:nuclear pore complex protein Nup53
VPAAAASYSSAGLFPSAGDAAWGSDGQYWITVFGYPTSARAFILSHFQTVGEVSNFISGAGNWLHLRYHTRLQAEQALALDGQTLGGGSAMIGVKKCYPSELDGVRQEPASSLYSSRARQNPGSRFVTGRCLRSSAPTCEC